MQKRKSPAVRRAQIENHHRQVIPHIKPTNLAAQYLARRFGMSPLVAELVAAAAGLGEPEARHG